MATASGFLVTVVCIAQETPAEAKTFDTFFESLTNVELVAEALDGPEFTVAGQVRNSAGEPVAGAVVVLREGAYLRAMSRRFKYGPSQKSEVNGVFARACTDADGNYHFDAVRAPEMDDLAAARQQHPGEWSWDIVAASPTEMNWSTIRQTAQNVSMVFNSKCDLRLLRSHAVEGRTLDLDGKPLPGMKVNLWQLKDVFPEREFSVRNKTLYFANSPVQLSTRSDATGRFRFDGIPAEMSALINGAEQDAFFSTVRVTAAENVTEAKLDTWPEEDRVNHLIPVAIPFELKAEPSITARGKLLNVNGNPMAGIRVATRNSSAITSEDGSFAVKVHPKAYGDADDHRLIGFSFRDGENLIATIPRSVPLSKLKTNVVEFETDCIAVPKSSRVTGTVLWNDDQTPVVGARIRVLRPSGTWIETLTTNEKGGYATDLRHAKTTFTVDLFDQRFVAPDLGHVLRYEHGHKVPLNAATRVIDTSDPSWASEQHIVLDPMLLEKPKSVTVQVIGVDNKPIRSASVCVRADPDFAKGEREWSSENQLIGGPALTDEHGECVLRLSTLAFANGRVDVGHWTGDSAFFGTTEFDTFSDQPVKVELQQGVKISGRVLEANEPACGLTAQLSSIGRVGHIMSRSSAVAFASTDHDGRFQFFTRKGQAVGVHLLRTPDGTAANRRKRPPGGKVENDWTCSDYNFMRSGNGVVRGVVRWLTGQPVGRAHILMRSINGISPSDGPLASKTFRCKDDGKFELTGLPPGQVTLLAMHVEQDVFQSAQVICDVDGPPVKIRLDRRLLQRPPSTAMVVKEKRPLAETYPAYDDLAPIKGRVVDTDGNPIEGAYVHTHAMAVQDNGETKYQRGNPQCGIHAITDEQGNYQIDGVSQSKRFVIAAGAKGYRGRTVVDVKSGGDAITTELRLLRDRLPSELTATVVDVDGKPIAGCFIKVRKVAYADNKAPAAGSQVTSTTVTDIEGKLVLKGPEKVAICEFTVNAPGRIQYTSRKLQFDTADQQIRLPRAAAIESRLFVNRLPLANREVTITKGTFVRKTKTDVNGVFRFANLMKGFSGFVSVEPNTNGDPALSPRIFGDLDSGVLTSFQNIYCDMTFKVSVELSTTNGKKLPPDTVCKLLHQPSPGASATTLPMKQGTTNSPAITFMNASPRDCRIRIAAPGYTVDEVRPWFQSDASGDIALVLAADTNIKIKLRPNPLLPKVRDLAK